MGTSTSAAPHACSTFSSPSENKIKMTKSPALCHPAKRSAALRHPAKRAELNSAFSQIFLSLFSQIFLSLFSQIFSRIFYLYFLLARPAWRSRFPSRKLVSELVYKRCHGRIGGKRVEINTNKLVEDNLGQFNIICLEDLVNEIVGMGQHFSDALKFIW